MTDIREQEGQKRDAFPEMGSPDHPEARQTNGMADLNDKNDNKDIKTPDDPRDEEKEGGVVENIRTCKAEQEVVVELPDYEGGLNEQVDTERKLQGAENGEEGEQ